MTFRGSEPPGRGAAKSGAASEWARCAAALDGSRISILSQDLKGRFTWVFNPPAGSRADAFIGRGEHEVLPPDAAEQVSAARRRTIETGESEEIEVEIEQGRSPHWFDVCIRPERDETGAIIGTVASAVDVTDRKVQEEHLKIVLRELAHRSKNLLQVIQGIARQTAESTVSTDQFVSRFNGRIYSLSRAHDVLTDADWRGARIFDLVRSQVALYAQPRVENIVLDGENGFLRPNAAQYVGLAVHELVTNAVRYGALSSDSGIVEVRFEKVSDDPALYRFAWRERNGPKVRMPRGRSFGLLMLGEVVPTSVGGAAHLDFEPSGLRYQLTIPRPQLVG
ncbi:MAG TPA: HWE histidine kinase domain-containing protein [Afifellaceae bacterium]|nr:HWE histidine kinase domain-containing protein [Afifellaceae bacterium]